MVRLPRHPGIASLGIFVDWNARRKPCTNAGLPLVKAHGMSEVNVKSIAATARNMALEVVPIEAPQQLAQAFAIRRIVFVEEQGVSEEIEIDGLDDQAEHLLAVIEGRPVGTLRMRLFDGGRIAKIERVAVLAQARGRQVGEALMRAVLTQARARGAAEAKVHAQTVVQDFYTRLGFVAVGAEFEEDGIAHIAMMLSLGQAAP